MAKLSLTRKPRQRVRVGDLGWIEIVTVRGDCVKLCFDFPEEIHIDREEIYESKLADIEQASTGGPDFCGIEIQKDLERGKVGLAPITEDYDLTE